MTLSRHGSWTGTSRHFAGETPGRAVAGRVPFCWSIDLFTSIVARRLSTRGRHQSKRCAPSKTSEMREGDAGFEMGQGRYRVRLYSFSLVATNIMPGRK